MCYILVKRKRVYYKKYKDMIIALRNKLIITQEELAKMLGVSYVSVNRWENGHHEPTIKVKRKILELYKKYNIKMEEKDF